MALTGKDIARARQNFAMDKKIVYLNHASHGPLPIPARVAYDSFLDSWQKTLHQHDKGSFEVIEDVRNTIATMIKCGPERVGLAAGTSYGFNIVAGGLRWRSGDNVVVSKCEFPAVVYPWTRLRAAGVEIRMADCVESHTDEDSIISLADKRTRAIAVSWVQFHNGFRADLHKLGKFCLKNDTLLCVDGMQGTGVIPIDVPALKIDLFTCGGQKWLLGPCGTGFYYLSERAEKLIEPPLQGWLSVDWRVDFSDLMRYDLPPRNGPARYELMTYPFQDLRAFDASLSLLLSFDENDRWDQIRALTGRIIEIAENGGFKLASSREESRRSGIVNIRSSDPKKLFEFLQGRGFALSYREGGIRISPHFYNSLEEIEMLGNALVEFAG